MGLWDCKKAFGFRYPEEDSKREELKEYKKSCRNSFSFTGNSSMTWLKFVHDLVEIHLNFDTSYSECWIVEI